MTQATDADRVKLINKLLAQAEDKATTPEEAESFSAKAAALMLKWGIEQANLDSTRHATEQIVSQNVTFAVPKTYSYEYALVAYNVIKAMSCEALLLRRGDFRVDLTVIGYERDLERALQLTRSVVLQCTFALGVWFRSNNREWFSSGDRYKMRRGFIRGYASGVKSKLDVVRQRVIKESAPGTDLILVDRADRVTKWMDSAFTTGKDRGRRSYERSSHAAGHVAGTNANIGSGTIGGNRLEIER